MAASDTALPLDGWALREISEDHQNQFIFSHREKVYNQEEFTTIVKEVENIYIYKVVAFVCVCVCVYNSPTAHTTGPIMTKPGMMMVPHLMMVHTIFQGKGQRSRS